MDRAKNFIVLEHGRKHVAVSVDQRVDARGCDLSRGGGGAAGIDRQRDLGPWVHKRAMNPECCDYGYIPDGVPTSYVT